METQTKTDIMDRLKGGYSDACNVLNRKPVTLEHYSFLPPEEAEVEFATHKIFRMIEAINEGHIFNYNDYKEKKCFPVWDLETYGENPPGSGFRLRVVVCTRTSTYVGARLSTRSLKHSRFVAELMEAEYKILIKK